MAVTNENIHALVASAAAKIKESDRYAKLGAVHKVEEIVDSFTEDELEALEINAHLQLKVVREIRETQLLGKATEGGVVH